MLTVYQESVYTLDHNKYIRLYLILPARKNNVNE